MNFRVSFGKHQTVTKSDHTRLAQEEKLSTESPEFAHGNHTKKVHVCFVLFRVISWIKSSLLSQCGVSRFSVGWPLTQKREDLPHLTSFCSAFLSIVLVTSAACAQSINAKISVISLVPARAVVEGEKAAGSKIWSFRNAYAGILGLGERIENLTLADANGSGVPVRKLAPGEYEATRAATRFRYEIKLDPPMAATNASHVSWLAGERGLLMLGDLLPLSLAGAKVSLSLPTNWSVASPEVENSNGEYEIADAESATFFVGQDLRVRSGRASSKEFNLALAGNWAFADTDAANAVSEILKEFGKTLEGFPRGRAMVIIAPFPRNGDAHLWSAETRGSTVIFLSGRSPSKTAGLADLSVRLAHELFHFWVPNGLALDGDYDWFYEGFTLYQAMRAGMKLGFLSFQDYLNAMGRAFDGYMTAKDREGLSLPEASRRRWSDTSAVVYNKGMLVAFLYDLTVRQQTKGNRSLDDVYRELFRRHNATQLRQNGNSAVINVLNSIGRMQSFTRNYIESSGEINLTSAIAPFGLQVEPGGVRTRIAVADELSQAQRDLLRRLGYNERANVTSKK